MKLIKAVDLAKMMGISRQGVYYLIKKKIIFYYLVDTKMYVPNFEAFVILRKHMLKDGFEDSEITKFFISVTYDVEMAWGIYRMLRKKHVSLNLSHEEKRDIHSKILELIEIFQNGKDTRMVR